MVAGIVCLPRLNCQNMIGLPLVIEKIKHMYTVQCTVEPGAPQADLGLFGGGSYLFINFFLGMNNK